jgi:dTDP-4-dehydrorhamnose 3,5-epimerase
MRFTRTHIAGVVVVDLEPAADDRGFFARLHCPDEFAEKGYPFAPAQTSLLP